jgi:hypothetical protein
MSLHEKLTIRFGTVRITIRNCFRESYDVIEEEEEEEEHEDVLLEDLPDTEYYPMGFFPRLPRMFASSKQDVPKAPSTDAKKKTKKQKDKEAKETKEAEAKKKVKEFREVFFDI